LVFAGDAQLGALSRSAACAALPLSTEHYLDFITEDRTQAQNRYETPVILQCSHPFELALKVMKGPPLPRQTT